MTMKLWGGNYEASPDAIFWEFNRSFPFDRRLVHEEIAASRAWVRALGRCGAIQPDEAAALERGLDEIVARLAADPKYIEADVEDVHSFVEERLGEIVGELAGQAHLGRSRNEQTVTALRLFSKSAIDALAAGVARLVAALVEQGRSGADAVMPGYTHTRAAEPITFGFWAAAHAWGLVRDRERLRDARIRVDVLPLGSGALAGASLPLDREAMAKDLGFAAISPAALDAVMDRDFAVELVSCCAQLQTHLARISEDLIHFAGPEYGFVRLPEAFTTGSSLMPQKKNPDALERDVMRQAAAREEMMAAGLAVALAREGMPFRKAHGVVGSLVARAQKSGRSLKAVAAEELAGLSPAVAARLDQLFDPLEAVKAKSLPGGAAPDAVRASLDKALAAVS
jgi:argininosuccinate lyase